MLHIRPNYKNPNLKCYYCSHNTPAEEYEETQRLYFIKSGLKLWLGYKYTEVEVHIPRCKECFDLHYPKGSVHFFRILWALSSALVFFLFYKYVGLEKSVFVYFMVGLISIGFGAVISGIVAKIKDSISPQKGVRPMGDYDKYPPINRLERLGFLDYKPDPSKGSAYVNEDLTPDDIESAFKQIKAEDDCIISGL